MPLTAALFDVDGTLTADNVWKGLMVYFARRGERRWTHFSFLALHYPLLLPRALRVLSETAFRGVWSAHLPWYFRGFDAEQMRHLAEWVAREFVRPMARPRIVARLHAHLARGDAVALVSGAPAPIVEAVARMWAVPHAIGSPAEIADGRYTGRLAGAPCIDAHKAVYVRRYLAEQRLNVDLAASYAYADSYSDLGMFELVGHPVAVHPDKKLAALAAARGWSILGESRS